MNFPILQLQELHRSRVFPDVDHPSKALSNVFPEKRRDVILAGLHMPVCRFVLAITGRRTCSGIESFAHSRSTTNSYDA